MNDSTESGRIDRRSFLAAGATGLALAGVALARAEDRANSDAAADDAADKTADAAPAFAPIQPPRWLLETTRMSFLNPGEVLEAADAKVQVVHTNVVWPYYPLRRDGGGLSPDDARKLRELAAACHGRGMRLSLGLPPFPPVALIKAHPDWRIDPDGSGSVLALEPLEDNLGTRIGCNLGPWGDYLIELCAELVADYGVDGFSFDGNYHPTLCHCPACQEAFRKDTGADLPAAANLELVAYRRYLVWRGERLEDHYRRLQHRIKEANPNAVLISWTVNAGRYGHFLHSPRAMPSRMNLLFDLPMQEWWHDETNLGASVAPAFGAAYLRCVSGDRPCASEPYLMSRGNPYGTDSFPAHERLTRTLLNVTHGGIAAESLGWPGHRESARASLEAVARREPWITRTRRLPWAAMLVSEQTRQFYAWRDIADRFLPHVFGTFRAALEEHMPLVPVNDWDITAEKLAPYSVLVLPNAAALSEAQVAAVREFVAGGGGLVATGESSLCDELGQPRGDFSLSDVLGVRYEGRPKAPIVRPELDANFAVSLDESYWRDRVGVARLTWTEHELRSDDRLMQLVPYRAATFKGPQVQIAEPAHGDEVLARMVPEGWEKPPLPAVIARKYGKGRVVYFAAAVDAALWSYAYPYQRLFLTRAIDWAARSPRPITLKAPLCVQSTYFTQEHEGKQRLVMHFFNGLNTAANHGLPAMDVPLREETLPIAGIRVLLHGAVPRSVRWEPEGKPLPTRRDGDATTIDLPPLEIHSMLLADY